MKSFKILTKVRLLRDEDKFVAQIFLTFHNPAGDWLYI